MIPENLNNLSEFEIAALFRILDPLERNIMKMRFGVPNGEPKTLSEVSEAFDIEPKMVQNIEIDAMTKLGWIELVKPAKENHRVTHIARHPSEGSQL